MLLSIHIFIAKDVCDCDCEYKDVRYSGLSFRLLPVSVEFPIVLVRFRAPAYSDSVPEPVFSEPDPVSANKYRNGSRNGVFPSVSVRFHHYLCLARAQPATASLLVARPHTASRCLRGAARLARPTNGTDERPDLSGDEEAHRLVGGGRGKQAT
jgi:hypothetical protein